MCLSELLGIQSTQLSFGSEKPLCRCWEGEAESAFGRPPLTKGPVRALQELGWFPVHFTYKTLCEYEKPFPKITEKKDPCLE